MPTPLYYILCPFYQKTFQRAGLVARAAVFANRAPGGGLNPVVEPGLRLLILVEFVVRRQLGKAQGKVAGLYPGQATRATASLTAELILRAFQGISLTVVETLDRCERCCRR
jgi:hypothetical protein